MVMESIADLCFGTVPEEPRLNQEPLKKCVIPKVVPPTANGCFDCNICLDFATDPVVTLCGHLYCWPCIYKWLQVKTINPQRCPVCKATLSSNTLVPLYSRGHDSALKNSSRSSDIPRRPSIHSDQEQHHGLHNMSPRPMETRIMNSTAGGVLGGMAIAVLPWVFRNDASLGLYHSNSYYQIVSGGNTRLRRQEMELETSLHQIWIFLFCCTMLCLLLF
ncbi:putative transcription factor C2H2 family [Dioscorea sansibarensis]